MFKNSIFTNPVGWAESMVGSKPRYVLAIVTQILIGLLTAATAGVLCSDWNVALLIFIPVLFFVIVLPIFYVVALRKLVLDRTKNLSGLNPTKATE